jgi:hypothetical protein
LATAVTKTGEHLGAYLDNKPSSSPRITRFVFSSEPPSAEVPPRPSGLRPDEPDDRHEALDQYENVTPEER